MRIIDVANAAGVSLSTVYRVLNGSTNISPATRGIVRRAISEVGYIPNKTKTRMDADEHQISLLDESQIAVLSFLPSLWFDSFCCHETMTLLSMLLGQSDIRIKNLCWPADLNLPLDVLRYSRGFIILEGSPCREVCDQFKIKPVVSLFCDNHLPGDQVLSGHYQAGGLAARYFIDNEIINNVVFYTDNSPDFVVKQVEGFKIACSQKGNMRCREIKTPAIPQTDNMTLDTEYMQVLMDQCIDQLLVKPEFPIGIFMPSCYLTSMAYSSLKRKEIEAGKEIFFICSGLKKYINELHPRPAFIDIGIPEIVENAVALLAMRLKNPKIQRHLQLSVSPRLIYP